MTDRQARSEPRGKSAQRPIRLPADIWYGAVAQSKRDGVPIGTVVSELLTRYISGELTVGSGGTIRGQPETLSGSGMAGVGSEGDPGTPGAKGAKSAGAAGPAGAGYPDELKD